MEIILYENENLRKIIDNQELISTSEIKNYSLNNSYKLEDLNDKNIKNEKKASDDLLDMINILNSELESKDKIIMNNLKEIKEKNSKIDLLNQTICDNKNE